MTLKTKIRRQILQGINTSNISKVTKRPKLCHKTLVRTSASKNIKSDNKNLNKSQDFEGNQYLKNMKNDNKN